MTRTIPKRKAGKAKMSDQGIGEALVFGFGILLFMKAGCVPKPCLQYCMRTESGVRYPSAEKLKKFSRRGIDHEPSQFSAISGHCVSKTRICEGEPAAFTCHHGRAVAHVVRNYLRGSPETFRCDPRMGAGGTH